MDIIDTAKEFTWGVLKRAYWFIPALLSRPLDVIGLVAPGTNLSLPATWLPSLLLFCFFMAAMLTYHDLRQKKLGTDKRFEEATSKRLEIVFGTGDPFEQEQPIQDSHGNRGVKRLFRVGIRNSGGTTIVRTEAKIELVEPATDVRCPVPLRIMHDNPPEGQPHRLWFSLDAGQTQYVDAIMKDEWPGKPSNPFVIPHTVPGHTNVINPREYKLTVLAHGEGALPSRKMFIAHFDGIRLRFREAIG